MTKKSFSNLETIKLILKHYKKANGKTRYYTTLVFGFVTSLIAFSEPFFFINVINKVEWFYQTWVFNFSELFLYLFIWGLFIVFTLIVSFIYRYYFVDIWALKYYVYVFNKYSKSLLKIEYDSYLSQKSWELYSQFNKWIRDSFALLFFLFLEIIRNSGLILVVVILFFINPIMALTSISLLPILIFVWYFYNKKTATLQKDINDFDDKNYWILGDSLTNMSLVKNLSLEKLLFKKVSTNIHKSLISQISLSKRWSFSDVNTGFLVALSRSLVIVVWVYLISIGDISLALLFLYYSFVGWFFFPLSSIFARLRTIQEQFTTIAKFFKVFWNMDYEKDLETGITIKKPKWEITLKDVSFSYIKGKKVIDNISLHIKPGEKIAFVWNTGAGKSTIISLLFRLWDSESGSIQLDWINIKDISKLSLRHTIWLVAQDNSLFNMSIKENLTFAKPDATRQEIESALKKAQAEFVFTLDKWINTVIWERWLKLSWGEKQRISIARLFLKNPKILILDEATSALDNKTEKKIQKALNTLMKWRTSIIIAHRLSTIQDVDTIYMLKDGKIIESWNYDKLMKKKKKFYELANPDNLLLN